jgi:hypothetical protein
MYKDLSNACVLVLFVLGVLSIMSCLMMHSFRENQLFCNVTPCLLISTNRHLDFKEGYIQIHSL